MIPWPTQQRAGACTRPPTTRIPVQVWGLSCGDGYAALSSLRPRPPTPDWNPAPISIELILYTRNWGGDTDPFLVDFVRETKGNAGSIGSARSTEVCVAGEWRTSFAARVAKALGQESGLDYRGDTMMTRGLVCSWVRGFVCPGSGLERGLLGGVEKGFKFEMIRDEMRG